MTSVCETVKETIRDELKKELGFVNDAAREKIANSICGKIHTLLDTSEEVAAALNDESKKLGW